MKSTIKFDLNDRNESVIKARIVLTEDVRDKVAFNVKQNLAHESVLALVQFQNEGIINLEPELTTGYTDWEIKTLGPDENSCAKLAYLMGSPQLKKLVAAFTKELDSRIAQEPKMPPISDNG